MNTESLARELAFYRAHKEEYLPTKAGRFVVIKGEELHGDFATFQEALKFSLQRFGDVSVLIKQVVADEPSSSFPALMAGIPLVYVQ